MQLQDDPRSRAAGGMQRPHAERRMDVVRVDDPCPVVPDRRRDLVRVDPSEQ